MPTTMSSPNEDAVEKKMDGRGVYLAVHFYAITLLKTFQSQPRTDKSCSTCNYYLHYEYAPVKLLNIKK